jgi:hypothetical protein
MNERSLPTSECKLQAFYVKKFSITGMLRAARNDKAAGFCALLSPIKECVTAD